MSEFDYSSARYFEHMYKKLARKLPAPEASDEYAGWREQARAKLAGLLGMDKYERVNPLPLVYECMDVDGEYVRERAIIRTEPDVWMPFFILHRKAISGRHPAAILPPPEGAGKFGTVWSDDYQYMRNLSDEKRAMYQARWEFAFHLADDGYLVVAPDTRGTGERREWMDEGEDKFETSSHRTVNNVAFALGMSLAGITAWELARLADYLETRPDCDGRFIAGGMESAGAQAAYFAATDDRVKCVFAQDWLAGYEKGIMTTGDACSCNFAPGLWRWFECGDVAGMLAPAALIAVSTTDMGNVTPQAEIARRCYNAAGCADRFHMIQSDAPERCPDERVIALINGALKN